MTSIQLYNRKIQGGVWVDAPRHQYVDPTMHYARLYGGTVAADYFKAMDRIESLASVPAKENELTFSPGELFGLLAEWCASVGLGGWKTGNAPFFDGVIVSDGGK